MAGARLPVPPPTSGGSENLLNFITWYMYSVGRGCHHQAPPLPHRPPLPQSGLTIMAPGHEDPVEPAVGLIHAEFCAAVRYQGEGGSGAAQGGEPSPGQREAPVSRILEVRVVLEGGVAENHGSLGTASDREGVSNDRPLQRDRQLWGTVGVWGAVGVHWPAPQVVSQTKHRGHQRDRQSWGCHGGKAWGGHGGAVGGTLACPCGSILGQALRPPEGQAAVGGPWGVHWTAPQVVSQAKH